MTGTGHNEIFLLPELIVFSIPSYQHMYYTFNCTQTLHPRKTALFWNSWI